MEIQNVGLKILKGVDYEKYRAFHYKLLKHHDVGCNLTHSFETNVQIPFYVVQSHIDGSEYNPVKNTV